LRGGAVEVVSGHDAHAVVLPRRRRGAGVALTAIVVRMIVHGSPPLIRLEARVVARETAVLVARDRAPTTQAIAAASLSLANDSVLTRTLVSVTTTATDVIVTISGDAPGVLRGTSAPIRVTVALPLEGWVRL